MFWSFSIRSILYPKERYIWAPIKIIRETNKTILVDNGRKIWIPKSRIYGEKLENNTSDIYTQKNPVK